MATADAMARIIGTTFHPLVQSQSAACDQSTFIGPRTSSSRRSAPPQGTLSSILVLDGRDNLKTMFFRTEIDIIAVDIRRRTGFA